jgi:hypothetical protein
VSIDIGMCRFSIAMAAAGRGDSGLQSEAYMQAEDLDDLPLDDVTKARLMNDIDSSLHALRNEGDGEGPIAVRAMVGAALLGNSVLVRELLSAGVDANGKTKISGNTALAVAAYHNHVEVIQLLLREGADISAVDGYGWSALMLAAEGGHVEVMQLLLREGAQGSYSALLLAASEGHAQLVSALLDAGATTESATLNTGAGSALTCAAGRIICSDTMFWPRICRGKMGRFIGEMGENSSEKKKQRGGKEGAKRAKECMRMKQKAWGI